MNPALKLFLSTVAMCSGVSSLVFAWLHNVTGLVLTIVLSLVVAMVQE